jgi:hypothetical protein
VSALGYRTFLLEWLLSLVGPLLLEI